VIYERDKQAGEIPDWRIKNGGGLGNKSFKERLMDVLYHLFRLTTNREAQDVVYCDNIPLQKKVSQRWNAQLFYVEKDRCYRLYLQKRLSLGCNKYSALKQEKQLQDNQ